LFWLDRWDPEKRRRNQLQDSVYAAATAQHLERDQELTNKKRMRPAGQKAFAARTENKSGIYSYEQRKNVAFIRI
jgi:hypothetical protein